RRNGERRSVVVEAERVLVLGEGERGPRGVAQQVTDRVVVFRAGQAPNRRRPRIRNTATAQRFGVGAGAGAIDFTVATGQGHHEQDMQSPPHEGSQIQVLCLLAVTHFQLVGTQSMGAWPPPVVAGTHVNDVSPLLASYMMRRAMKLL